MKTLSVVFFFILLSLLCGFGNAIMIYQNESQLILTSDQIVFGKIVEVKSAWNTQNTHIETTAQILVDEAFVTSDTANISSGTTIPVTVLGGKVGDTYEWVEDMPVFVSDSDVFVYLKTTNNEKFTINGLNKGIYSVSKVKSASITNVTSSSSASDVQLIKERITKTLQGIPTDTDPRELSNSLSPQIASSTPIISSVTPSSASAGTDTQITITGSGFGNRVSRTSLNDVLFYADTNDLMYASGYPYHDNNTGGYIVNGDEIRSWNDTQIKVNVPTGLTSNHYWSGASSGWLKVRSDTGALTAPYAFTVTFSYSKTWGSAKWKWNSSPTYFVNADSLSGISGATTAIQNAAATWNNTMQPDSFFRFKYGGTTPISSVANEGISTISLGSPSYFANQPNTIAFANCFFTGQYLSNCDIIMNPSFSWTTGTASGSTVNVETIILHELGHWTGLCDLYGDLTGYPSDIRPTAKVMFGSDVGINKNQKTLSTADSDGIRWIYPPSFGTKIGTYNPDLSIWYLDYNGNGIWEPGTDKVYLWGAPGYQPVTGNWDGSVDGKVKIGTYNPDLSIWYLDYNGNGIWEPGTDKVYLWGDHGYQPVIGNWDGSVDGKVKIGTYNPDLSIWYLDYNGNGQWEPGTDKAYNWGAPGYQPVTGDWNGDRKVKIGTYNPDLSIWYLDYNGNGQWEPGIDKAYNWGAPGYQPVTGDWNGDRKVKIGTYNPDLSIWYLDYNGNGQWEPGIDKAYNWGAPGYQPVTGDWNGDRKVKIGTYNPDLSIWYLDYNGNGLWEPGTDKAYRWGAPGYQPVTGNWDGSVDGKVKIGTYNPDLSIWYLDYNGNGLWEPGTDKVFRWGAPGYAPVVGKWS
jgi:hypothetical protein